jgi:DNA invertase Pin-like site-specific DNA recombinase
MKQSNEKKHIGDTAALYVRLSRDDGLDTESNSIQTQKALLTKVAKEKGYSNLLVFADDGISGVTMNRPGFIEMIGEIEKGYISAVFVKDLSRLGRNYIEVGKLTEEFFPEHDIRLVAVSDGVDSAEGENDLNPIRNLFNEWYSRDISKKRRTSNKIRGNSGEPLGLPPFGYMKDPDDPKHWIIDEEAAAVVRRIYSMTLGGFGTIQIANALTQDKVLTPIFYWRNKGLNRPGKVKDREPHEWNGSTVFKILTLQEYCGDVINFKTFSKSYKNKTRFVNDEENRAVFLGVHEAVIDRETWEKVQAIRGTRKRTPKATNERSIFSGLLKCADCGSNLNYHFNQRNHEIKYFNCSNNNNKRENCPTTHYVRLDFLEQVVLQEFHRLAQFADTYEDDFVKAIIGCKMETAETDRAIKQRALDSLLARDKELDTLFERLYEDNVAGKISDERFAKMSGKYEQEQAEIAKRVKALKLELKKERGKQYTADTFLESIRRYTNAQELTQRMVVELIDHIDVHHAEKVSGLTSQRITIYYNCIGQFEVPSWDNIPELDITLVTRKGVALCYSQFKKAV